MPVLTSVAFFLRLAVLFALAWGAYQDLKTRRVSNWVWIFIGALGALAFGAELVAGHPVAILSQFGMVAGLSALGYAFWRAGFMGGADAKAIIALTIAFPASLAFASVTNAILLGASCVIAVLMVNAYRREFDGPWMTAVSGTVGKIGGYNGRIVSCPAYPELEGEECDYIQSWTVENTAKVWVEPGIPFVTVLFLGTNVALLYGNLFAFLPGLEVVV